MSKNIRLLVGLRWWSDFRDDGTEVWVFESPDHQFSVNKVDSAFFWSSQVGSTITWLVLTVLNVLTFNFIWVLQMKIFILDDINKLFFLKGNFKFIARGDEQRKFIWILQMQRRYYILKKEEKSFKFISYKLIGLSEIDKFYVKTHNLEHNKKLQEMQSYIAAEGMKAMGKALFNNNFMK